MKKLLLIALGIGILTTMVLAANVGSIPVKSTGNSVSYTEFNNLVNTIRGIFNKKVANKHNIGINTNPSDVAALKLNGIVRVSPITTLSRPDCTDAIAGSIYADSTDNHLRGCDGTSWVQLDTEDPICP